MIFASRGKVLKRQRETAVDQRDEFTRWMDVLLQRAEEAGVEGEVPVAAVILDGQGRAIGHGRNRRQNQRDPLGHAELVALRQASIVQDDWRFNNCTLIVTLEPCPMCAGALVQARMGTVVFAATDPKRGGLGGSLNLSTHASAHHHMKVIQGVREVESKETLERWFKQRRRANR